MITNAGRLNKHFNPRSPKEERHSGGLTHFVYQKLQSTLPERGATVDNPKLQELLNTSIHAPRKRSD